MRSLPPRIVLSIIALVAVVALVPTPSSSGQDDGPPAVDMGVGGLAAPMQDAQPAAAVAPSAWQPGADTNRYLPLSLAGPRASALQFAAQVDNSGAPVNPATTFNYGIQDLFMSSVIEGAVNINWRMEVSTPSGSLLDSGSERISSQSYRATFGICRTTFSCDFGKVALLRGTYVARLYVNEVLYQQASAVIR